MTAVRTDERRCHLLGLLVTRPVYVDAILKFYRYWLDNILRPPDSLVGVSNMLNIVRRLRD